jgi:chromosome segregation ATPase
MANEQRNAQAIREELEVAQRELHELQVEAGHLDQRKREAFETDHAERMKAARKGGKVREVLKRRRSKVQEIEDRRAELTFEIHALQVREAELRIELADAQIPAAQKQVEETRKALGPADEEFAKAEAKHKAVHDEYGTALAEANLLAQQKRDAELEIERLNRRGPEVAGEKIPQSPNAL